MARKGLRLLVAMLSAVACVAVGAAPASAADGYTSGRMSVSRGVYVNGGNASRNDHGGYNFYFGAANGTVSGGIKVRWVKCGEESTQDGASSVGGTARQIDANGTIGIALGTGFRDGACVRAWARGLSSSGSFGYENYFNNQVIA